VLLVPGIGANAIGAPPAIFSAMRVFSHFSPVQLACMAQLCDPAANSFVACGDFNQRITSWGSRSDAD
jgi:hypothetical protein